MLVRRQTIIGPLCLETMGSTLVRLYLPTEAPHAPLPTPGGAAAAYFEQIDEYLLGRRRHFDIPVLLPPHITRTGKLILQRIAAIPYGCTATYGSLGPARVVGHICATNPLPLIIPCHRVVPAHHAPGQYRGGTELKCSLLHLEATMRHLNTGTHVK